MSYEVKIKNIKYQILMKKKCIIFLILNLSGPNTDDGSLAPWGSPQRRGQGEGAAPGSVFSCVFY
jgi:hypothetical protein